MKMASFTFKGCRWHYIIRPAGEIIYFLLQLTWWLFSGAIAAFKLGSQPEPVINQWSKGAFQHRKISLARLCTGDRWSSWKVKKMSLVAQCIAQAGIPPHYSDVSSCCNLHPHRRAREPAWSCPPITGRQHTLSTCSYHIWKSWMCNLVSERLIMSNFLWHYQIWVISLTTQYLVLQTDKHDSYSCILWNSLLYVLRSSQGICKHSITILWPHSMYVHLYIHLMLS